MSRSYLPVSAFNVDKVARLRAQIKARIAGLDFQFINVLDRPTEYLEIYTLTIQVLNDLLYRLDGYNVIRNTNYSAVRRIFIQFFPSSIKSHSILLFGRFTSKSSLYELYNARKANDPVQRILDSLMSNYEDSMIHGRKRELMTRLEIELKQRFKEGWFILFNTLTVEGSTDRVFGKDVGPYNAYERYIRSMDRIFAIASHGSIRSARANRASGTEYHSYFAVVELGTESGRPHIHVLHLFKDMPKDWSDPNFGAGVPNRREIEKVKSYWSEGLSSPLAVRVNGQDAYAVRLGWRWPVQQVESDKGYQYEPLKDSCIGKVAGYVGKYISKNLADNNREYIWRTRISRNMARTVLKLKIQQLPLELKLVMLKSRSLLSRVNQVLLPKIMMRRLLLLSLPRNIFRRLYLVALRSPVVSLFKHLRTMIVNPLKFSLLNFGDTAIPNMQKMAVFKYFEADTYSLSFPGVSYSC